MRDEPVRPDDSISAVGASGPGPVYRDFNQPLPPLFYGTGGPLGGPYEDDPQYYGMSPSSRLPSQGYPPPPGVPTHGYGPVPARTGYPGPNSRYGPFPDTRYGPLPGTGYGPLPETRWGPLPQTGYSPFSQTNPPINPIYPPPQTEQPPVSPPKSEVDVKGKDKAIDPPLEPEIVDADDDDWRYSAWRWGCDPEGARKDAEDKAARELEARRAAESSRAGESSSRALVPTTRRPPSNAEGSRSKKKEKESDKKDKKKTSLKDKFFGKKKK